MPQISIIIPCYNQGQYLTAAVDSVLSQTFQDFEIIIINDGSSDNTEAIALEFCNNDSRVKYIHQKNQGLSAARNSGIKSSQGTYLQFLDSDDLIEPQKLEFQAAYLDNNPEVDIVYGGARYFPDEFTSKRYFSPDGNDDAWMPNISGSGEKVLEALLKRNIMPVCSPLVRRNIFQMDLLFDTNLVSYEDWDLWIRCALQNKKFIFLDSKESLSLIRFHSKSLSTNLINMYDCNLQVRSKIMPLLSSDLIGINKRGYNRISIRLLLERLKKEKRFIYLIKLTYYGFRAIYFKFL